MVKTYTLLILSALILMTLGFSNYDTFFELVKPVNSNFQLAYTSTNEDFKNHLYFGIVLGLIPLASYQTWRFAKISLTKHKIISLLIVLTGLLLALTFRAVSMQIASGFGISDLIINQITVESLKFEQYMFGGILLGMLISWAIFNKKAKKL